MDPWHSQDRHPVRLEWGLHGARSLTSYAVSRGSPVIAVVVDVLSFTTSVSVALDLGIGVHPYRWRDDSARAFADTHGAVLARPRSATHSGGGFSLSPASFRAAAQAATHRPPAVVLPSPNGSTITAELATAGATVVAGSLRNRVALAAWLVGRLESTGPGAVVVPAGERWPDGSLRPAVEDLWGAGAVAAAVLDRLEHRAGPLLVSPEARAAVVAFDAVRGEIGAALAACASGRELEEQGWADDVAIAAELDSSRVVPVLHDGLFERASLPDERPEGSRDA